MTNNNMTEILDLVGDEVREMYLEHLRECVPPLFRARARNPEMYTKIEPADTILHSPDTDWRKVWVWSDQHFWHKNIIEFCERPYRNVEHMHTEMGKNYRMCIGKDDICIWVGDVTFGKDSRTNHFLQSFPGYKILIVGNHDFHKKKLRNLNFDEVHLTLTVQAEENEFLVFTHYPFKGNKLPHDFFTNMGVDVYNIHGHIHNRTIHDSNLFNVSVEAIDYCPSRLGEIVNVIKQNNTK